MNARDSQLNRISGATSVDREAVLFVGVGPFGADVRLDPFERFGLVSAIVDVKSRAALPSEREMGDMASPVVVVLGLSDQAQEFVARIRNIWSHSAIIIAGAENRLGEVYPLLAAGAQDFVALSASPEEIQAKCMLRIGAYRSRVNESSRTLGRLTINLMQRTVTNGSETASLTPIEIKIVTTLADSLGGVVQRNEMKHLCWGDAAITDNALNRKIYEVRRTLRKLSEDVNIRTIYGMGFELSLRPEAP